MAQQGQQPSGLSTEQLMEMIQSVAFTPEKLKMLVEELKKPYVDPAAEAREQRERAKTREDYRKMLLAKQERQKRCRHKDDNEAWAFSLIHNYPDRKVRGICMHCDVMVGPATWDYTFDQQPFQHPEHPLYSIVEDLEQKMYAQV